MNQEAQGISHLTYHLLQIDLFWIECHLPCLHLGQVQHIVDELEQVPGT